MPMRSFECGDCHKTRVESRFSKNSIRKFESSLRAAQMKARDQQHRRKGNGQQERSASANFDNVIKPRCMDCTPSNVNELKCASCSITKSLEEFSKNMRKDPDNALCLNCSQDRQDLEPEHADQVQEEITMERLRLGGTITSTMGGSATISHSGISRAPARSNGPSAPTDWDTVSNWMQPPIPVPHDPRAWSNPNSSRSPSDVSVNTHLSNLSTVSQSAWRDFERTNAPYREQVAFQRGSNGSGSRAGGNPGFVKQGAVKQDPILKAQEALGRQQKRELDQANQAALGESDDNSDSDSDDPPY